MWWWVWLWLWMGRHIIIALTHSHGRISQTDNAVNGIPSCANGVFNNDVLRKTFGFAGMIVSDCGAVAGIMRSHNYTHTTDSTVRAALEGGTDLNCGTFYLDNAGAAIKSSAINTSDIDTALRRVFAQFYKVGLGENPVPWSAFDENDIDTSANRAVALDAARQVRSFEIVSILMCRSMCFLNAVKLRMACKLL